MKTDAFCFLINIQDNECKFSSLYIIDQRLNPKVLVNMGNNFTITLRVHLVFQLVLGHKLSKVVQLSITKRVNSSALPLADKGLISIRSLVNNG
jgi:hypothetical protein